MKPESGIYAILGQVCLFKTIGRECVEKKNLKCFLTERTKSGFCTFVQVSIIIGFIFAFYHSSINCKAEWVILGGILEKSGRVAHTMQAEPLSTTAC